MSRRLLPVLAALSLLVPALRAEPDRQEVLSLMERVADWQLAHPSKWKPHE